MKAFKIHTDGETDFVSSTSMIKAILFYHNETGKDIEDFEDDDFIEEIPESEFDTVQIKTEDHGIKTIRQLLKDDVHPSIFASTAY